MPTGFHITNRSVAKTILKEGFLGGWGDLGYGVYFYGTIHSARKYAASGGWDHELKNPVIIEVNDPEIEKITESDLDPSWEPEKYSDMYWHPVEDESDEYRWKPEHMWIVK